MRDISKIFASQLAELKNNGIIVNDVQLNFIFLVIGSSCTLLWPKCA
jgi:hypothetical protein